MPRPQRVSLLGIIGGLMTSENFGDVHDEIIHLHDLVGLPKPKGGFIDGWHPDDWKELGAVVGEDSDE